MKEVYLKEPPIIYGYMIYECEKCGARLSISKICSRRKQNERNLHPRHGAA